MEHKGACTGLHLQDWISLTALMLAQLCDCLIPSHQCLTSIIPLFLHPSSCAFHAPTLPHVFPHISYTLMCLHAPLGLPPALSGSPCAPSSTRPPHCSPPVKVCPAPLGCPTHPACSAAGSNSKESNLRMNTSCQTCAKKASMQGDKA